MQRARALSAASGARTFITSGARRVTVVVESKARGWSVAVVGTVTARSEEQLVKASSAISVTDDGGMVTASREVQPAKVEVVVEHAWDAKCGSTSTDEGGIDVVSMHSGDGRGEVAQPPSLVVRTATDTHA